MNAGDVPKTCKSNGTSSLHEDIDNFLTFLSLSALEFIFEFIDKNRFFKIIRYFRVDCKFSGERVSNEYERTLKRNIAHRKMG